LVAEKTRHVNRIQKVLEDANIKMAGVATDIMGKSGRDMIEALIGGETDPKAMAELARGRMRSKKGQLQEALWGRVNDHHRYLLQLHYGQIQHLERTIGELNERIEAMVTSGDLDRPRCGGVLEEVKAASQETKPLPFEQAVARADEIPGIDTQAATDILAEIGTDMGQFPSEKHLCSWTRICPGNNESAGKRKSGNTGRGNRWLRRILTQVAWAASRSKHTYFAAQFRRIAKRRGKKRAIIAVAHSILTALYYMLKYDRHYRELGEDFFDRLDPERVTRYHVGRLEDLDDLSEQWRPFKQLIEHLNRTYRFHTRRRRVRLPQRRSHPGHPAKEKPALKNGQEIEDLLKEVDLSLRHIIFRLQEDDKTTGYRRQEINGRETQPMK
jgi:transposase